MEREPDDTTTADERAPIEVASEDLHRSTARLRKHLAERDQLVRKLRTGSPVTDAVLRELLTELGERTAQLADATDGAVVVFPQSGEGDGG